MIYTLGSMKVKYILAVTTTENSLCWSYRVRRHQGAMTSQMLHLHVRFNDSCCHRCSVQLGSNTGYCGPQWTAVKLYQAASEGVFLHGAWPIKHAIELLPWTCLTPIVLYTGNVPGAKSSSVYLQIAAYKHNTLGNKGHRGIHRQILRINWRNCTCIILLSL